MNILWNLVARLNTKCQRCNALCIPHICNLFYTSRIFESQYLKKYEKHPKIMKNIQKITTKFYIGQIFFTWAPPMVPVTNMRYECTLWQNHRPSLNCCSGFDEEKHIRCFYFMFTPEIVVHSMLFQDSISRGMHLSSRQVPVISIIYNSTPLSASFKQMLW